MQNQHHLHRYPQPRQPVALEPFTRVIEVFLIGAGDAPAIITRVREWQGGEGMEGGAEEGEALTIPLHCVSFDPVHRHPPHAAPPSLHSPAPTRPHAET